MSGNGLACTIAAARSAAARGTPTALDHSRPPAPRAGAGRGLAPARGWGTPRPPRHMRGDGREEMQIVEAESLQLGSGGVTRPAIAPDAHPAEGARRGVARRGHRR